MGINTSKATLTEKTIPDQTGKVFIVTGSTGGVGKELAKILFSANARVYIAGRSPEKAKTAIETIKTECPKSTGELVFLKLDLGDLSTIKASANEFLSKETRLDVLWNNAGVMVPPQGSKTTQGYELQLGTNNLAPFLFTKLLAPIMTKTAQSSPKDSVRVIWVSSSAIQMAPKGGVEMSNLDYKTDKGAWHKYAVSKAGNVLHSNEYASRYKGDGIVSVAVDPGFLKTDLWTTTPAWQKVFANLILHEPIYGAYTELYGGLSPDVNMGKTGTLIKPWGKVTSCPKDLQGSSKTEFWEWCEEQVRPFA